MRVALESIKIEKASTGGGAGHEFFTLQGIRYLWAPILGKAKRLNGNRTAKGF